MNETASTSEPVLVRHLKFYFFISIELPSVSISLYILYGICRSQKLRSALHNQSIIALLFIAFLELTTELPITLDFLRTGCVRSQSARFCQFWIWYNCSLHSVNLLLMAWTCIERHILIFHSHFLQTSNGRLRWHYCPLLFSLCYIPFFYFVCIFLYSCENSFDYTSLLCGAICYNNLAWLASFDWVTHIFTPSLVIPMASLILLIRVLIQRAKMTRILNWRRIRKLTVQLISISSLYSIVWVSYALVILIRFYFVPTFLGNIILYYFLYSPYFVQLLMPFLCLVCLPELWRKKFRVVPRF